VAYLTLALLAYYLHPCMLHLCVASPPEPENIRTRLAGLLQNDNAEAAAGAIASAGSEGFGSSSAVAAGTAAVNQAIAGKVEFNL
jgi:hypothetical protein